VELFRKNDSRFYWYDFKVRGPFELRRREDPIAGLAIENDPMPLQKITSKNRVHRNCQRRWIPASSPDCGANCASPNA
jgi:hypothetical protein